MKKKSRMSYSYSISNEILEVRIKENEKIIFREACPVNDERKIMKILEFLDRKGYFSLKKMINMYLEVRPKEEGWIE